MRKNDSLYKNIMIAHRVKPLKAFHNIVGKIDVLALLSYLVLATGRDSLEVNVV